MTADRAGAEPALVVDAGSPSLRFPAGDRPVGQVSLYRIAWGRGRAEYGRLMIGESDAAGRGLAREATEVLLRYATDTLKLREIALDVFADNTAAIAIYAACGFERQEERGPLLSIVHRGC